MAQHTDHRYGPDSPGLLPLLLLWALCVLASILVHELGHAFAFRACGIHAAVVLYHFGGLAIPLGGRRDLRSASRLSGKENLVIAAAGPAAQLLLAAVVIVATRAAGYRLDLLPPGIGWIPGVLGGDVIERVGLYAVVNFLVWPSVAWALLNLIPVWPLDGGQIARELILMFGGTAYHATQLSLVAAVAAAVWGALSGHWMLAIFMASFAASNYQTLQAMQHWHR